MRIYKNLKEAASETKRELAEMGTEVRLETMQDKKIEGDPDYFTKELIGYSFMVTNTDDLLELPKAFGKEEELEWAEAEFKERISDEHLNPGKAYRLRKVWDEFVHHGMFSYTYNERMRGKIDLIIDCLKRAPHTRNAILALWDPEVDIFRIGGKQRVPCSIYYQFLIRGGKLNLIYNIRSNDLMTHWAWDLYLAIKLQAYIAEKIGVEKGWFIQQVGSLHAYQKDLKGIF